MQIALIGLPGSGKSTIGRHLGVRLNLPFFDSDAVLERQIGCSIRDFFERKGESAFRDAEQLVIDELTQKATCVLSTGGGVVLTQANRNALHTRCQTIYLHSPPEEVFRRLRHDRNRPLLQVPDPLGRLKELYTKRDPLYREAAHFVVETGRPSIATLVNTIVMQLKLCGNLGADV